MNNKEIIRLAFIEAQFAYERGECPVGAVLIQGNTILARSGNRENELSDPTAHAEILVLREAGKKLQRHTFHDCVVYTSLWPCPMCANALIQAKVPKVICGARSFIHIYENTFNPSRLVTEGPIMSEECQGIFVKWLKETGHDHLISSENL